MENCWTILGVDGGAATERDVKAAYAKLLKLHRPDQDPEGFRRVRAAYEEAMDWLKQEDDASWLQDPEDASETEPDNAEADGRDMMDADDRHAALVQAMTAQDLDAAEKTLASLEELEGGWWSMGRLAVLFRDGMAPGQAAWVAARFSRADIARWWGEGRASRCVLVLAAWEHAEDTANLDAVASWIEQNPDKVGAGAEVMLAYEMTMWIAFWSKSRAVAMLDALFPKLPSTEREHLVDAVEARIDLGEMFATMEPQARHVWWMQLRLPRRAWDWESMESAHALTEMAEGVDAYVETYPDWEDRIPPHAWEKLWAGVEKSRDREGLFSRDSFWFRSDKHTCLGAFLLISALLGVLFLFRLVMLKMEGRDF